MQTSARLRLETAGFRVGPASRGAPFKCDDDGVFGDDDASRAMHYGVAGLACARCLTAARSARPASVMDLAARPATLKYLPPFQQSTRASLRGRVHQTLILCSLESREMNSHPSGSTSLCQRLFFKQCQEVCSLKLLQSN